jgi:hypothetical protein
MNARYYDPALGRFTSPDSIIPDPYNPQTLDRYAYVKNDPANHTDPSGHVPMQIELRKEQAADTTFAWMYFRSLQAQCSWWGQCPIAAGPAGAIYKQTPGQAKTKSDPKASSRPTGSTPNSAGSDPAGDQAKGAPAPDKSAANTAPADAGSNPPEAADPADGASNASEGSNASEATDAKWRYPDDGSDDVGLTIEELEVKYKWDQPGQCDRACQLGRSALGYLGCTGALCDSSGAPRPTSGIDKLAIVYGALWAAAATPAIVPYVAEIYGTASIGFAVQVLPRLGLLRVPLVAALPGGVRLLGGDPRFGGSPAQLAANLAQMGFTRPEITAVQWMPIWKPILTRLVMRSVVEM